jgi:hypothetical protein
MFDSLLRIATAPVKVLDLALSPLADLVDEATETLKDLTK